MLHDTVVIEGEVSLINQIDGDPDVCIGAGGGSQPTGTKSILLTEAGTKTEDVTAYASAEINAVTSATASGAVASFSDGAEDVPMASCVVNIEPVQSGSGDPSPSNVRPISGWLEVKVTRTGKNVYSYDSDNAEVATTSEQTQRAIYHTGIKGGTWTISGTINQTINTYINIGEFQNSIATLKASWATSSSVTTKTVTISDDAELIFMTSSSTIGGITDNLPKMTIQIELDSTETSYEPYTGTSYPISLGQTVYGGTLDLVTGVLTVTHGYIASYAGETLPSTWISDRDVYAQGTSPTTGAQVVYELATAQTVQLTPTEVKTLLGSNSVWADSGNISVGYKADVYLSEGGVTPTGTKSITITANGTTTEDVTNYASASITTNVPASAVDTGTKSISSNGTHDVIGYASASVAVPNSYSASDEGKVVSNGALVAQTSDTVTANDTYDTTLINSLTVNVSGGGGISIDDVAKKSISGAITIPNATVIAERAFDGYKLITSIYSESVTGIDWNYAMAGMTALQSVDLPNLAGDLRAYTFSGDTNLESVNIPKVTKTNGYDFQNCKKLSALAMPSLNSTTNTSLCDGCTLLQKCDLGNCTRIGGTSFRNTALNVLVLRNTSVATLDNTSAFTGSPFASDGAGGTLYVPSSLISSYQSASNWSTILGYTNNQIKSIESTHTDPTAPIDLTLYYADGTLIPTT